MAAGAPLPFHPSSGPVLRPYSDFTDLSQSQSRRPARPIGGGSIQRDLLRLCVPAVVHRFPVDQESNATPMRVALHQVTWQGFEK